MPTASTSAWVDLMPHDVRDASKVAAIILFQDGIAKAITNPGKAADPISTDGDCLHIPFVLWHWPGEDREAVAARIHIHQHRGRPVIRGGKAAAHKPVG